MFFLIVAAESLVQRLHTRGWSTRARLLTPTHSSLLREQKPVKKKTEELVKTGYNW